MGLWSFMRGCFEGMFDVSWIVAKPRLLVHGETTRCLALWGCYHGAFLSGHLVDFLLAVFGIATRYLVLGASSCCWPTRNLLLRG